MARQGQAGPALGIAAFGSFIAGTASVLGIMLLGPPLASVALRFGPPEIFGLLLLGFTMVTYLAGASKLKAVAMALVGLLLATVGLDPMTATPRSTYGTITLMAGIGLGALIPGLFGIGDLRPIPGEVQDHCHEADAGEEPDPYERLAWRRWPRSDR